MVLRVFQAISPSPTLLPYSWFVPMLCCSSALPLPSPPGCREKVIQPMGITPSGNLAPMENAIRNIADERSSSDSDLGLD